MNKNKLVPFGLLKVESQTIYQIKGNKVIHLLSDK